MRAKAGRPPKYNNADDLAFKIEQYFEYVKGEFEEIESLDPMTFKTIIIKHWIREPERITINGLALFLGFESRQSLYDYKEKKQFSYSIKRALTKIEQQYENQLFERNPAGAIFALKNFGWRDKQEIDHTSKGESIVWNEVKTYKDGGLGGQS